MVEDDVLAVTGGQGSRAASWEQCLLAVTSVSHVECVRAAIDDSRATGEKRCQGIGVYSVPFMAGDSCMSVVRQRRVRVRVAAKQEHPPHGGTSSVVVPRASATRTIVHMSSTR